MTITVAGINRFLTPYNLKVLRIAGGLLDFHAIHGAPDDLIVPDCTIEISKLGEMTYEDIRQILVSYDSVRPSIYVAVEPDEETVFTDVNGQHHDTREKAIDANFTHDLGKAVNCSLHAVEKPGSYDVPLKLVKRFIQDNPCMVRVLLGDREAT